MRMVSSKKTKIVIFTARSVAERGIAKASLSVRPSVCPSVYQRCSQDLISLGSQVERRRRRRESRRESRGAPSPLWAGSAEGVVPSPRKNVYFLYQNGEF